jgi:hypothetical protein
MEGAAESHLGKKCQFLERRVSTPEDLVNAPSSIPNNLSVGVSNVYHTVLWNKLLIGCLLLPAAQGDFQLSFKSVDKPNDIVTWIKS